MDGKGEVEDERKEVKRKANTLGVRRKRRKVTTAVIEFVALVCVNLLLHLTMDISHL